MQDKIIVCGSSNSELGKLISRNFSIPLAVVEKTKFASSETRVRILSDLKSKEVYLLQSLSKPTNDHLVELLLLADAANRMNPKTITAVVPWFGYAPQDKIFRTGEALSSEVVTSLLECANFSEIVFFDVHSQTVLQKFSKKVTELSMITEFARIMKDVIGTKKSDWCVAILDKGSNQRASEFAKLLNVELVRFEKSRDLHTGR
ncbi:MAG: ribose-phosphate diphosphokinase [Patescibacteria group bacterium]